MKTSYLLGTPARLNRIACQVLIRHSKRRRVVPVNSLAATGLDCEHPRARERTTINQLEKAT